MSGDVLPFQRNWKSPVLARFVELGLLRVDASLADVCAYDGGRLCYLASPYSKVARYDDGAFYPQDSLRCADTAAIWARLLGLGGVPAVSPIIQAVGMVHCDFADTRLDPLDVHFWTRWCHPLLTASACVVVPPIEGWDVSDGIWAEVSDALAAQKTVFLIKSGADRLEGGI